MLQEYPLVFDFYRSLVSRPITSLSLDDDGNSLVRMISLPMYIKGRRSFERARICYIRVRIVRSSKSINVAATTIRRSINRRGAAAVSW